VAGAPIVDGFGLSVPNIDGDAPGVGAVSSGLTPALPISTEPSGIPVRATLGAASVDGTLLPDPVQVAMLPGNAVPIPNAIPPPSYVPDVPDDVGLPAEHVAP
jgi:hypothetical protein